MGDWILIQDAAHWAVYKASLEKIPHSFDPVSFPCLVRSRYACSGSSWEHIYVYQSDLDLLFGGAE